MRRGGIPIFLYFMVATNAFLIRAPVHRIFFLLCNPRMIKPMEQSRKNKVLRFDTLWEEVGIAAVF